MDLRTRPWPTYALAWKDVWEDAHTNYYWSWPWRQRTPNLDEYDARPLKGTKRRSMKRTQSSNIICEYCRQGIRAHHGSGEGFFEVVPGSDGKPEKRWFHVKRCWALEKRRRRKEARKERNLK